MSDVYPYPPMRALPAPFDRIPNEIIMEIFKAFCGSLDPEYDSGSLDALPLCAVSRRWREVALAVPQLWSYVSIQTQADIEWMKFAKTRSRDHPITLWVQIPEEDACAAMLLELENSRTLIRDLKIDLATDDDTAWEAGPKLAEMTMNFLNAGMPALVALAVGIPDWPDSELPDPLLELDAHQFPQLRVLKTIRLQLAWVPETFVGLRELDVGDMRGAEHRPLSEFLDVLEAAQQLEDLSLNHAMPFRDHPELAEQRKLGRSVAMPNLRKLTIYDYEEVILVFLQHVRLPAGVRAYFEVDESEWQWDRQPTGVLPLFIPDDPTNVPFLETTTSANFDFLPYSSCCRFVRMQCATADTGRLAVEMNFCNDEDPPFMRSQCILEAFATLFRRAHLQRLSIRCDLMRIPQDTWTEIFRTFPALCELLVSGDGCPGQLLAALAVQPADPEGSTSEPLPLPKLPNLTVLTLERLPWDVDLVPNVMLTLEGRAVAGASRMREVRIELRGRRKDKALNTMLRLDLARLRKSCDVVVFTDVE